MVFENAVEKVNDDISRKVTTMNRLSFDKVIQQMILEPSSREKSFIIDAVVRNSILGIGEAYTSITDTEKNCRNNSLAVSD